MSAGQDEVFEADNANSLSLLAIKKSELRAITSGTSNGFPFFGKFTKLPLFLRIIR